MHTSNRHLTLLIIFLATIGITIFLYRNIYLGVPLAPSAVVDSWTVEANLRFHANNKSPIKASFIIPNLPPHFATLDEYFVSHNYGVTTSIDGFNRQTVWSIRRAHGLQSLYYRAIYRYSDHVESPLEQPTELAKLQLNESQQAAVEAITNSVRISSADIQTFAQETVKLLKKDSEGSAKVLVANPDAPEDIVKAAVMVLTQAKIAAMSVSVLPLKVENKIALMSYLAVYDGTHWIYINPATGTVGLSHNLVVWKYGDDPTYSLNGGSRPQFSLAVSATPVNALTVAKIRGAQTDSMLMKFSLLQLPVEVQQTYKILLTVPIGAFIILILRNFIGLVTFGTFMPILIALAFRETHVIWGVILFSTIVAFGLLARFYLDQLRLLLVPRLATILTVVILLMAVISIVSQKLGLETGLSVALFPMVILTMTIERMCITWDERGPADAIKFGIGSLVAAAIAYTAMHNQHVEYLVFAFPELLLVLMAIILWFGQYRGYRLLELIRFKALSKDH